MLSHTTTVRLRQGNVSGEISSIGGLLHTQALLLERECRADVNQPRAAAKTPYFILFFLALTKALNKRSLPTAAAAQHALSTSKTCKRTTKHNAHAVLPFCNQRERRQECWWGGGEGGGSGPPPPPHRA